jgi:hypothetical protein
VPDSGIGNWWEWNLTREGWRKGRHSFPFGKQVARPIWPTEVVKVVRQISDGIPGHSEVIMCRNDGVARELESRFPLPHQDEYPPRKM